MTGLCFIHWIMLKCDCSAHRQWIRHGAEQYTGDLEFILNGYYLDRAVPRMAQAVCCLMPSSLQWVWHGQRFGEFLRIADFYSHTSSVSIKVSTPVKFF